MKSSVRIAIVGAGPAGMFVFKKLLESGIPSLSIDIFEKSDVPGAGMPYSEKGACKEHVTNVSANQLPELVTPFLDWLNTDDFNEYNVMPRLLLGQYFTAQFHLLEKKAADKQIPVNVFYNREIFDVKDSPEENLVEVVSKESSDKYDHVIISTGHRWPVKKEKNVPRYFDSPYPPSKLCFKANHPVALKGASLTAIDAISTLALEHGTFEETASGFLRYKLNSNYPDFRIVMHSLYDMLPAVRFHFEKALSDENDRLTDEEVAANRKENNGFLSLDYVFENNFKKELKHKQPDFYKEIKDLSLEEFVEMMMKTRECKDPFELLREEYGAAEVSIRNHRSIHWKETLASLSYAINYPAKYFSAEDMIRLQKVLMPLIGIVIAFVPQSSAQKLLALHEAGVLSLIDVGKDSSIDVHPEGGITYKYKDQSGKAHDIGYKTFVNCTGQPCFSYEEFPYRSLIESRTVAPALLKFESNAKAKQAKDNGNREVFEGGDNNYYLTVPGVAINDYFQVTDEHHQPNKRIFIMAVPLIGGYNPDYSGLDFCDAASTIIVDCLKSRFVRFNH